MRVALSADATSVITEFPKNAHETVAAGLGRFDGRSIATLRVRAPMADGRMAWTARGITLDVARLPELRAAVEQLEAAARAAGDLVDAPSLSPAA